MNRKKGAILGELVSGTGALIVGVIITLIIVSTLLGANLLGDDLTTSFTVTNETNGYVNVTGYTLAQANASNSAYVITALWGAQGGEYNVTIPTTNATVSSTGVVTNSTVVVNDNVSISYTYTYTRDNQYEDSANALRDNMTTGITNVGNKIPTILLIAAVVLLFGVLVILVAKSREMNIVGSGSL